MSRERRVVPAAAAMSAMSIGAIVLVGWALDVTSYPGYASMKANTALSFVFCGLALWLARGVSPIGRAGRACAGAVLLIGLATLGEYVTGWDLHIDQLLCPDLAAHQTPGRMAVTSATCFVLVGAALLTMDRSQRWSRASQSLTLVAGVLGLVALVGHLYGVEFLHRIWAVTSVALSTAITLIVVCVGILFARPGLGVMYALTLHGSRASSVARRLLPAVIVLPILLGWLRLQGQLAGWYEFEFGLAIYALTIVVLLAGLVWWMSAALVRSELAGARAGEALLQHERDGVREEALLKEAQYRVEALRTSEAEFRLLAEAMPQIVWITRPDGGNIYFNQQWMDYTGLSIEESLGDGWNKPFHPDDQQRAWDAWQQATATVGVYSLECRLRRADGVYCWWLIRGAPVRGANGDIVKWFGTCTDIEGMKKLEQGLAARTVELSATLKEREVLLQEVHHRVKNNLQVISSLMNMQMRGLVDGAARAALGDCQSRVQAIALVHEKLYQAENYAGIEFSDYARSLVANVFHATGVSPSEVSLALSIGDLRLGVDKAIPCGLILNELITNALKHAFPNNRRGSIRVELGKLGENTAQLIVSDDGAGTLERIDASKSKSLGMRLVATLTRQLQGKIDVTHQPSVSVRVTFPIEDEVMNP
jgi:PAS domain S-box-containing protein